MRGADIERVATVNVFLTVGHSAGIKYRNAI